MDELLQRLRHYQPRTLSGTESYQEAAVLVPIIRGEHPELLLTLRASNLSTHGGEVALPGGRRDPRTTIWSPLPCARPRKRSDCHRAWWR